MDEEQQRSREGRDGDGINSIIKEIDDLEREFQDGESGGGESNPVQVEEKATRATLEMGERNLRQAEKPSASGKVAVETFELTFRVGHGRRAHLKVDHSQGATLEMAGIKLQLGEEGLAVQMDGGANLTLPWGSDSELSKEAA